MRALCRDGAVGVVLNGDARRGAQDGLSRTAKTRDVDHGVMTPPRTMSLRLDVRKRGCPVTDGGCGG